ncbi:MAG: TonB-dependent receptor [Neomegalonema sp.]|nr:TonB-dependent receptor [Neomegalonema sp.]
MNTKLFAFAVGLATLATPALAQEAATEATPETGAKAAEKDAEIPSLGRIVVSAGRDKVAIDTPQAVTVIDTEDLERKQPDTIGDAIDDIPGVKRIGSQRPLGESFNIRGIGGVASADEPRIVVTVDGAPKFYEQYRLGSFFSDPDLYKSVEVLRGPASSTLYGSGAIGGVISLKTKDPSDFLTEEKDWALRQKLGFSAVGGKTGFLSSTYAAVRLSKKAEFLVSASIRKTSEYKDGDGNLIEGSDTSTQSGLAKGVFKLGDAGEHELKLAYSWFRTSLNDEPYSQTGLGGGVFLGFGTVDRKVYDRTATATYHFKPKSAPIVDLTILGSYTISRNDQSDVAPSLVFAFGEEWTITYETYQLKVENTATVSGDGWESFLTLGSQFAHQIRSSEAFLFGSPYAIGSHPAGKQTTIGLYAQNEFVYGGWLTVIPGARVDLIGTKADDSVSSSVTIRSHDFTLFSPKLAFHAKVSDAFAVFGSVARTERAPVIDELYDTDNFSTATIGDPKKEIATNIELGLAFSFNDVLWDEDKLKLKATAFRTRIDDLIYRTGDGLPYGNAERALYRGFELEAGYDAGFAFGSAAYTMIRGKLSTGAYIDTIPADELKLTIGGRWRPWSLEFGWTGTFAAGQDRVSDPTSTVPGGGAPTDGYVVHGLFVGWKPDSGALAGTEFRFTAENITDRAYREHLSGDAAPGRTLRLSIGKTF